MFRSGPLKRGYKRGCIFCWGAFGILRLLAKGVARTKPNSRMFAKIFVCPPDIINQRQVVTQHNIQAHTMKNWQVHMFVCQSIAKTQHYCLSLTILKNSVCSCHSLNKINNGKNSNKATPQPTISVVHRTLNIFNKIEQHKTAHQNIIKPKIILIQEYRYLHIT